MMAIEGTRIMAADGTLPSKVPQPRRDPLINPLGYDTTDILQVTKAMADAAESGRNRDAVRAEIRAVERRLGFRERGAANG